MGDRADYIESMSEITFRLFCLQEFDSNNADHRKMMEEIRSWLDQMEMGIRKDLEAEAAKGAERDVRVGKFTATVYSLFILILGSVLTAAALGLFR